MNRENSLNTMLILRQNIVQTGKNGGYIWGELLVDPISRKYFATKLYEDEKREKERAIAGLNQVKKLYGQVIDTNKQLREQIQLLDRNINAYKNKSAFINSIIEVSAAQPLKIIYHCRPKIFIPKLNRLFRLSFHHINNTLAQRLIIL